MYVIPKKKKTSFVSLFAEENLLIGEIRITNTRIIEFKRKNVYKQIGIITKYNFNTTHN